MLFKNPFPWIYTSEYLQAPDKQTVRSEEQHASSRCIFICVELLYKGPNNWD